MCFKVESSAKNEEMFKEHLLEEPDEKESVRHRKIYDYFQIETFYKISCENCEHWALCRAHVKSMLSLHYGVHKTLIPAKIL